ncbi:hypothetical protein [Psychroserpens sp. NJDZ02]|uniref:hypothetical protein n=1 Tax=Psychroserpens sp. NJDZ02 TaxID=2570561 RepID=UPI0010A8D78A|nr:hypothetical protein [Psychroserpens sp. NJDZ02]QCE40496.1 hypothetical protein E9099_03385 [Psychroserpens sp. NJDZ02]
MNKFKIAFSITFFFLFCSCYNPKGEFYTKHESPKGEYVLEVYQLKLSSSFRTHGDSPNAYVILKNKEGKIISKPSIINKCNFILNDLSVEWFKHNENKVHYTNISYIDIDLGEMICL